MMNTKNLLTILFSFALPLLIGSIAGIATSANIESWYATLNKPTFNPPNYLFAPVWTVLYLLMGYTLYSILKVPTSNKRTNALWLFGIQLALNFAWSFLFFEFKTLGIAFIEILILWVSILLMILAVKKINPTAAYLQIPYLAWVSFATLLNFSIWQLN